MTSHRPVKLTAMILHLLSWVIAAPGIPFVVVGIILSDWACDIEGRALRSHKGTET